MFDTGDRLPEDTSPTLSGYLVISFHYYITVKVENWLTRSLLSDLFISLIKKLVDEQTDYTGYFSYF